MVNACKHLYIYEMHTHIHTHRNTYTKVPQAPPDNREGGKTPPSTFYESRRTLTANQTGNYNVGTSQEALFVSQMWTPKQKSSKEDAVMYETDVDITS